MWLTIKDYLSKLIQGQLYQQLRAKTVSLWADLADQEHYRRQWLGFQQRFSLFSQQPIFTQSMLVLFVGGSCALILSVLPGVSHIEQRLVVWRAVAPAANSSAELVQIQVQEHQAEDLLHFLESLPPVKAIGLDTPIFYSAAWLKALQSIQQKKDLPLVLAAQLDLNKKALHLLKSPDLVQGVAYYPEASSGLQEIPAQFIYRSAQRQARQQQPAYVHQLLRVRGSAKVLPDQAYVLQSTEATAVSLEQALLQPERWQQKTLFIQGGQSSPVSHLKLTAALMQNQYLSHPDLLNQIIPVLLMVAVLLLLGVTLKWGLLVSVLAILTLIFSYFSLNLLLLRHFQIWLDLLIPLGAVLSSASALILYFQRTEGRARQQLYSTIRRHLPDDIARNLLEKQGENLVQNTRRVVTVMFTDIQGFSRMGEKLPSDQIIQILNEYLTAMTEIIFAYHGSLDKYIGDGIMAVFGNIGSNNPRQDAYYAVKAALEMQVKMAELQKKWMDEGIRPIQIRIGINTGEALVGYVGHPRRRELTVIGDTVNTTARIEKLNKQYRTHILISHGTYEYVKDMFIVSALGEEQLKGKSTTVMVYEVKGCNAQGSEDSTGSQPVEMQS